MNYRSYRHHTLAARYAFFRENAGSRVGRSAEYALCLARAELRAEELGLVVLAEEESEPWDGDCEPPNLCLYFACFRGEDVDEDEACVINKRARSLASVGMVGLDGYFDPYWRVVSAELFAEALDVIDAENDETWTREAEALASRATYAAGG